MIMENGFRLGIWKYKYHELYHDWLLIEFLIKLSRATAIFEFSSPNRFVSFNLNFECRSIEIIEPGDENQSRFSYLVSIPSLLQNNTTCEERGYETWDLESEITSQCISTFQGL